jgi:phosphoglycolate phosphatase
VASNKYTHLVLFDIDGTLVHCGAAPKRVFKQALLDVFGTAGPIDGWVFDGKTDPQIVRELMDEAGVSCSREMTERALNLYSAALQTELPKATDKTIYPGVRELLEELLKHPILLGLLTGNIKPGARAKLESLDLWKYFSFGAVADDSAVRREMADIAVQRAFELAGQKFTGKQIVIIGDTEYDINCGRHLGVRTIGVGTGRSSAAKLLEHGADFAFEDFRNCREVICAILQG